MNPLIYAGISPPKQKAILLAIIDQKSCATLPEITQIVINAFEVERFDLLTYSKQRDQTLFPVELEGKILKSDHHKIDARRMVCYIALEQAAKAIGPFGYKRRYTEREISEHFKASRDTVASGRRKSRELIDGCASFRKVYYSALGTFSKMHVDF